MRDGDIDIGILGGGVSGITCGILLQIAGYTTRLFTRQRADTSSGDSLPEFSSLYPAASAIPHSVTIRELPWHVRTSLSFLEAVHRDPRSGVRLQPHCEVSEQPVEPPEYAPLMVDYEPLPDDGSGADGVPFRPGADAIFGCRFQAYFAQMPLYLPWLYRAYRQLGGTIEERAVTRDEFPTLGGYPLVNCTGRWAPTIVDDSAPFSILRGHLVHLQPVRTSEPLPPVEPRSYNYFPRPAVYAASDGSPADVYFYPRDDAWLIGGTRQAGHPEIGAEWAGEVSTGPTTLIDGLEIPDPVLALNFELIEQLTAVDVRGWQRSATLGYRFARDLNGDGVRLDVSEEEGVLVVHNYGHGGAGVALSWSCALRVLRLLEDEAGLARVRSREVNAEWCNQLQRIIQETPALPSR